MYIGYLLHFQGPFQRHRIKRTPTHVKDTPGIETEPDCLRQVHQQDFFNCPVTVAQYIFKFAISQEIGYLHQDSELCDEGLCSCHTDFGSGTHEKGMICCPADRTTQYVRNCKACAIMHLCLLNCGDCIGSLPGLRDSNNKPLYRRRKIFEF